MKLKKKNVLGPVGFDEMVKAVEINNALDQDGLQEKEKHVVAAAGHDKLKVLTKALQEEHKGNFGKAQNILLRLLATAAILGTKEHNEWNKEQGALEVDDIHPAVFLVAAKIPLKRTKGVFNKRKFFSAMSNALELFDADGNLIVDDATVSI